MFDHMRHVIATRGVMEGVRYAGSRLLDEYFDRRLSVRTVGFFTSEDLGLAPDCRGYEALHYLCLQDVFRRLRIQSDRDVLLDYGAGRGRIVRWAARFPFRRIIGVEVDPGLAADARENLARAKRRCRCKNVSILQQDASHYVVPSDVTMAFLYNPFRGQVLSAVQRAIRDSVAAVPRRLFVVYVAPDEIEDTFAHCDWLEHERTFAARKMPGNAVHVYRARPSRCGTPRHSDDS